MSTVYYKREEGNKSQYLLRQLAYHRFYSGALLYIWADHGIVVSAHKMYDLKCKI